MVLAAITKLKIGYVFVILLINFTGMLPIRWKLFRANPTFLSILNSFAGGVFLAMAFVHILPESVETYVNYMYKHKGFNEVFSDRRRLDSAGNSTDCGTTESEGPEYPHLFPVPYVLFLSGYGLVLFVDRIAKGGASHSHNHGGGGADHSHFPDLDEFEHDHHDDEYDHNHNAKSKHDDHHHHHEHNHEHNHDHHHHDHK